MTTVNNYNNNDFKCFKYKSKTLCVLIEENKYKILQI